MEEVLSKFIPNFKLENIERDKEISRSLILTLIEEKINTSSSPFLVSILEYLLKKKINEYNIIFLGEKESLNYYANIGRKMGINLLKKENNFIFVDIIGAFDKLLKTQLPLEENVPDSFNQVKKGNDEFIQCDKKLIEENNMNKFYTDVFEKIKDKINNNKDNAKKWVVVFDVVRDEHLQSLDEFMKFCFEKEINLIFSINKELISEKIFQYIQYLSDIILYLKNNESGFSKDISGILEISFKKELNEEVDSFRYNLASNYIKIFNHINI